MGIEQELLTQTADVAQEYAELSIRLRVITKELIAAIRTWDEERVETLLQSRAQLCDKVSAYASVLEPLVEKANHQAEQSDSLAANQVLTLIDQIFALHNALIVQQSECESALSEQLSLCKSDLVIMNRRRGLKNAYSTAGPSGTARFLDSKL